MKIAICDDDARVRNQIERLILDSKANVEIHLYQSGEDMRWREARLLKNRNPRVYSSVQRL